MGARSFSPAYEQAVREQKMRTEISQAKRENTHYLENVSKGKEIEAIIGRKRKRGVEEVSRGGGGGGGGGNLEEVGCGTRVIGLLEGGDVM